jgi:transposase-like protein
MEPSKRLASRAGFSPEFKREFIEKIVTMDRTLGDLAEELGIPPEVMRKWTLMVERAETIASAPVPRLVPASRVLELEHDLEELRRVITHQATTIQILEKKETPSPPGRGQG